MNRPPEPWGRLRRVGCAGLRRRRRRRRRQLADEGHGPGPREPARPCTRGAIWLRPGTTHISWGLGPPFSPYYLPARLGSGCGAMPRMFAMLRVQNGSRDGDSSLDCNSDTGPVQPDRDRLGSGVSARILVPCAVDDLHSCVVTSTIMTNPAPFFSCSRYIRSQVRINTSSSIPIEVGSCRQEPKINTSSSILIEVGSCRRLS